MLKYPAKEPIGMPIFERSESPVSNHWPRHSLQQKVGLRTAVGLYRFTLARPKIGENLRWFVSAQ